MAPDYNQRLPDLQLPGNQGVNNSPYPYVRFTQYRDGSWERQDETPNNTSRGHGSITGSHNETDTTGAHKEHQVTYKHSYAVSGSTHTVEANHDHKIGGSHTNYVSGDKYSEHGGDHMFAVGGQGIHAMAGSLFMHSTAGVQTSSTGDHVTDFNDGSHYHNIAVNDIKYVQGVRYLYVGQDHGIYMPNGSYDTNVSNNTNFVAGNNHTNKAGNNYIINANNTVIISVGNSVITVTKQSITIVDGNNNQIGMTSSKMWVGNPQNTSIPVFLGGNGQNISLYANVSTMMGPSINVMAKYQSGTG